MFNKHFWTGKQREGKRQTGHQWNQHTKGTAHNHHQLKMTNSMHVLGVLIPQQSLAKTNSHHTKRGNSMYVLVDTIPEQSLVLAVTCTTFNSHQIQTSLLQICCCWNEQTDKLQINLQGAVANGLVLFSLQNPTHPNSKSWNQPAGRSGKWSSEVWVSENLSREAAQVFDVAKHLLQKINDGPQVFWLQIETGHPNSPRQSSKGSLPFSHLFSPTTDESFCFEPFSIAVAFNTLLFRYLPQWLVIALPIPWYFDSYETNFFRYLPRWTQAVGPQDQWRRRRTQQGWALADFPATFFHMIYI